MQHFSIRAALISIAAVTGAVIWGTAELIALQWSRAGRHLHTHGNIKH